MEEAKNGGKLSSPDAKSPTSASDSGEAGQDRPVSQQSTEKASTEHSQPPSPAHSVDEEGSKSPLKNGSTDE